MGYWQNLGQLTDPEGSQTFEASFYSEGIYPVAFPAQDSRISFTVAQSSSDSLVPDTLLRWDVQFTGDASQQVNPVGVAAHNDYRNFYFPHCGDSGITHVRRFEIILYQDVYSGIDLYLYPGRAGQKIALVCQPGSDPAAIRMLFAGASGLSIAADGSLQFPALAQVITLPHPLAYQYEGTNVLDLPQDGFQYVLEGNEARFGLGSYDPALPLVLFIGNMEREGAAAQADIQGLCWSTYFGGNGIDIVMGSSQSLKDSHYAAGYTSSTWATFPSSIGSPSPYNLGIENAFVSRFSEYDELMWTTLFGGGGSTWTHAYDVAVKDIGYGYPAIYVVGNTLSANFPVLQSGSAYYDGTGIVGVPQGFIFKLNNSGIRTWGTYFGNEETPISSVAVGGAKDVVFTGYTKHLPSEQVSPPAGSTHYGYSGGSYDAFVAMLNTSDQFNWGTYFGGDHADAGYDIACSPLHKGVFYVVGQTNSPDVNLDLIVKPGAYNATYSGGDDLFVLRFDPFCKLKWATCFGGPGGDGTNLENLAVDWEGDVYIGGYTNSTSFPLHPPMELNAYYDPSYTSGLRGFLVRFNRDTQEREWCTFLAGGSGSLSQITAVTASKSLSGVFVAGSVSEGQAPVLPVGYWYYQPNVNPNFLGVSYLQDPFITRFDKHNVLVWSTHFGGNGGAFEFINSLLCPFYSESVLAYGRSTKYQNPNDYFPLQHPFYSMSYYDDTWNSVPVSAFDCFITRFCSRPLSRPMEEVRNSMEVLEGWSVDQIGDRLYRLKGDNGIGTLHVLNSMGQLLQTIPMHINEGLSQPFSLSGLPAGIYLAQYPGMPTQRICLLK